MEPLHSTGFKPIDVIGFFLMILIVCLQGYAKSQTDKQLNACRFENNSLHNQLIGIYQGAGLSK